MTLTVCDVALYSQASKYLQYTYGVLAPHRGDSNSIAKYCNTFEILRHLLQYFRNFTILIGIF